MTASSSIPSASAATPAPETAPVINLAVPDLRGNEAAYLEECVRDNWVSSAGPHVTRFERALADLTGAAHAVAVVNGTCGLELAVRALGLAPGSRVVVPDWTFAASANAVIHAGMTPYFLDVGVDQWGLDPDLLAEVLADPAAEIRAVMLVHPLGAPGAVAQIAALCAEHGVPLIEDAAGAIGSRQDGRALGTFGRAGVFSFNGNKLVTAGGGGMILTDDADLADWCRACSAQSRSGAGYYYDHAGMNYRMTNLNAAVGLAQLERLDAMMARKHAIAARYDKLFEVLFPTSRPCPVPAGGEWNAWMACRRLADGDQAEALVAALMAHGIRAQVFWRPLHDQPPYVGHPNRLRGRSETLGRTVVALPCSSGLSETEQDRVLAAIESFSAHR